MINKNVLKFTAILSILFLSVLNSFAQVDVPRKATAITYPLDLQVNVIFRGTTRYPRMKGAAKIKRTKKNGTEIKLSVSKMPRPFELGAGYATYILWAISPNGQIDNLGEIKRRGFFEFDSTISVTTPLQTFALLITAEPHFLVSRPSQEIMLENLRPSSKDRRTIATSTSIQYFGNSSNYFRDPRTPEIAEVNYRRTPTTVLQAKQAVALAKYAGAERDAPKLLQQAQTYLNNAENGWKAGREEEYVDIAARKAISTAVRAENMTNARREARDQRSMKLRRDAEIRDAEEKADDARREVASLKASLASETRSRELSERDAENYLNQIRNLQSENKTLRQELEDAKVKIAAVEAKQRIFEKEKSRRVKAEQLDRDSFNLVQSLKRFGKTIKNRRGIVLTLREDYWSGVRVSSFSKTKMSRLNELAVLLLSSPDYKIIVEAHIDTLGEPAKLQVLTNERARAIADKIVSFGVTEDRVEAKGFGGTIPVASNSTRANRSKNRRVHIILVPSI